MAYKDPLDERARAARRKHYENNREQYYKNNRLKKQRMVAFLYKLKDVPCMDCGKKYPPFVMDFDHRDPIKKVGSIGQLLNRQSWSKLKAEVVKCDVVCANCHRVRTAKLLNYGGSRKATTGLQNQLAESVT